jgi:hypothetical protein
LQLCFGTKISKRLDQKVEKQVKNTKRRHLKKSNDQAKWDIKCSDWVQKMAFGSSIRLVHES